MPSEARRASTGCPASTAAPAALAPAQLALAALIESGRYDRHLRRMRAEYSTRRETLIASLAEHASQLRLTGLAAGFHAVAHLPAGAQEERIVALARAKGMGLHGMSRRHPYFQ